MHHLFDRCHLYDWGIDLTTEASGIRAGEAGDKGHGVSTGHQPNFARVVCDCSLQGMFARRRSRAKKGQPERQRATRAKMGQ